jgi:hypothetical protein
MTKRNQNKLKRIHIFLIVLLICFLFSTTFIYCKLNLNKPILVKTMNYDFQIKENVGFVLDSDILHFGGAPKNSELKRNMTLTTPFTSKVKIYFEGPGILSTSHNNFLLEENQSKSIEFILKTPNLENGNYTGKIFFEFYKP